MEKSGEVKIRLRENKMWKNSLMAERYVSCLADCTQHAHSVLAKWTLINVKAPGEIQCSVPTSRPTVMMINWNHRSHPHQVDVDVENNPPTTFYLINLLQNGHPIHHLHHPMCQCHHPARVSCDHLAEHPKSVPCCPRSLWTSDRWMGWFTLPVGYSQKDVRQCPTWDFTRTEPEYCAKNFFAESAVKTFIN